MPERPPRRNGRPPLDVHDPSVRVTFRLPSRQYDALYERARRERTGIADVIRHALRPTRPQPADDDE